MNEFACAIPIVNVRNFARSTHHYVHKPGFHQKWGTREINVEDLDGRGFRMGSDATGGADKDALQRSSAIELFDALR